MGCSGEEVDTRGSSSVLRDDSWSAADIAVFTLVVWLEGMPARASTFPPIKATLALGWSLPRALSQWADRHRQRPDVLALG